MVYYLQRIDERSCLMVQENQQQARLQEPVLVILQRLCMRHGSTFEGRRAAAALNLDIHQKVPILLSEIYRDVLFPAKAMRNPDCIWINYRAVDEVRRLEKGCVVQFHDESKLSLSVDIRCIRRSMRLCERYLSFLNS